MGLAGLLAGLVLAAGPALAQAASGSVVYVDADATGAGTGTSWADAFTDLQAALAVAEAGDEVWVAEGVYKPTDGAERTATFTLASGIALYGGFDGTEQTRDERDWTVNETVLSGDVGTPGDSLNNAYHVVTAREADSTAVLDGFTVERGRASGAAYPDDRGAGVLVLGGSPTIRHAVLAWNFAVGGGEQIGGGAYVEGGSALFEDAVFEDNGAFGGGLYASGGAPVLRRVTFRRNVTGALWLLGGSSAVVEDALFEGNTGSGAFVEHSSPVFRRATFRDNTLSATGFEDGAGVHIQEGAPNFEDCLFERLDGGLEGGLGGGVRADEAAGPSSPVFVRTTFRDNAANSGGAVSVENSSALFLFCRFEHNTAYGGGALYVYEGAVVVIGSTFVGNRAVLAEIGDGGAIEFGFPPEAGVTERPLVVSTLFAGNTAEAGGAVSVDLTYATEVRLVNVTFAGNEASEEGGALQVRDASGVRIENAVLWGNAAPVGPQIHVTSGSGPTVERSIVEGGYASGTDVLDEDPRFARPPSPGPDDEWGTEDDDYGDLRLQEGSAGIDYGLVSLLPADVWDVDSDGDVEEPLPVDLDGEPRVEGSSVDVGAYEGAVPVAVEPVAGGALGFWLEAASPNPFIGRTAVPFALPEPAGVELALYDVLGRRVALLAEGRYEAGRHVALLDGAALPSGTYLVRLRAVPENGGSARAFTTRISIVD